MAESKPSRDDENAVGIKIQDQVFSSNKSTLTSFSEYFKVMFSGPFVEKNLRTIEIDLVGKEDFALYLDFMNEGNLRWQVINSENITRVLESATMLQITKFLEACDSRLLEEWEKFGNAAEMYSLSSKYGLSQLRSHLLRLLAKYMDVSFAVDMNDLFYGIDESEQRVFIDEVSYEYLSECLRETTTSGEITFGSTKKVYFDTSFGEANDYKALLEWVVRWLLIFLNDQDVQHSDYEIKINKLLKLCNLKFISRSDIREVLDVSAKMSDVDNVTALITLISQCIDKQKIKIEQELASIEMDFVLFPISCIGQKNRGVDEVTIGLKCLPTFDNEISYRFNSLEMPVRFSNDLVAFDYRGEIVCLYEPSEKRILEINLETKELKTITSLVRQFHPKVGVTQGGFLVFVGFNYGWNDNSTQCIIATFDFKSKRWHYETFKELDHNVFCVSNLVFIDGYLYFMANYNPWFDPNKCFLYRYNPATKKLECDEQTYSNLFAENPYLLVHDGRLIVIGQDLVTVLDTATFNDKFAMPLKIFPLTRDNWRVLGSQTNKANHLHLICDSKRCPKICISDLHVFRIDLEEGFLEPVGCMQDVFTDFNHKCRSSENSCTYYSYVSSLTTSLVMKV